MGGIQCLRLTYMTVHLRAQCKTIYPFEGEQERLPREVDTWAEYETVSILGRVQRILRNEHFGIKKKKCRRAGVQAACRGMNRDEHLEREGGRSPSITLFPQVAHPVSLVALLDKPLMLIKFCTKCWVIKETGHNPAVQDLIQSVKVVDI